MKEVFQIFDKDGNKSIDRSEAQKHWATVRFGKISANEFFNTVDYNNDGKIEYDEFVEFWEIVKGSGHTEEEIKEEVRVVVISLKSFHVSSHDHIAAKNQEWRAVGRFR